MKRLTPMAIAVRERMVIMTEHLQAALDWAKRAHEVLLQEHDEQGRHHLPWHSKGFIRAHTGGPGYGDAEILETDLNLEISRVGTGQVEIVAPPGAAWPSKVIAMPFFATDDVPRIDRDARVVVRTTEISRGLSVQRSLFTRMAGGNAWHTLEDGEFAFGLYGEW